MKSLSATAFFLLTLLVCRAAIATETELPQLNVDASGITVSGLSSGAYMAVQLHVAYSATFAGVAALAGGPYHCAGNTLWPNSWAATNHCMDFADWVSFWGPPGADASVTAAEREAMAERIDALVGLRNDRVYLFSGSADETVPTSVVSALEKFYQHYAEPSAIRFERSVAAGHAMITTDTGDTNCRASHAPYFNDCDFDLAGELLRHLYGGLALPVAVVSENLKTFVQSTETDVAGLHSRGHIYVPTACAEGASCRLHVALHGCHQYEEAIGDLFYRRAGYNRWAESNNIIVLYPQAQPYRYGWLAWPNPNGCWDWWGYGSRDFHVREAPQMRTIMAMVAKLRGVAAP